MPSRFRPMKQAGVAKNEGIASKADAGNKLLGTGRTWGLGTENYIDLGWNVTCL